MKRLPRVLRPGPDSIEPGLAPGGLVAKWFDVDGRLLLTRRLMAGRPVETLGRIDRALTFDLTGDDVCLVVYDGDDGHRISVPWSPPR